MIANQMDPLFRQRNLAFDTELSRSYRRSCARLAASHADCVITLNDHWIAIPIHHTQIAIF